MFPTVLILYLGGLQFAFGNTTTEAANSSSEWRFVLNVQNSINKLNIQLSKSILEDTKAEENVLFSALNIYTTLTIIQIGTTDTTRDELSTFLGLTSTNDENIIETHERLSKILNETRLTETVNVSSANIIFIQDGLEVMNSYLWRCKDYYRNEAQLAYFTKGGNNATDTINNWISKKTNKRTPKLFQNPIPTDTKLMYVSTIHFSAAWAKPFPKEATKLEKFNTGLKEVDIPMMNAKGRIGYINNPSLCFEAINLPYISREFSMLIILPYTNHSLLTLVNSLTPEHYEQLTKEIVCNRISVDYKIPRFKLKRSQSLNRNLIKLGVQRLFGYNAELDNFIGGERQVAISNVVHLADIEVNENGTTSATVTSTILREAPGKKNVSELIEFYVDRPYLFSIHHHSTGVSLFTGLVQNPIIGDGDVKLVSS